VTLRPGNDRGITVGNFNNWVLDTANRYVGKPLGFIFSDAMEITVPLVILIGLIAGWIYLRPRRSKY
jgi:hypothetical protein